ncbi:uncharacterized protein M6B38_321490 [Iris pallida]|uniref:Uncharacterized protein n=1 Tax=Iris pallida TaxID=29817 RepID=A0AAX6HCP0_IRIPA|nr:uncharacterized protein M6B38_321490 [Iris pallida]
MYYHAIGTVLQRFSLLCIIEALWRRVRFNCVMDIYWLLGLLKSMSMFRAYNFGL